VGSYYGTFEAQELIASLPGEDLGITPLRFDNAFYCRRCLAMATGKTCPHPDSEHVALSGTQVRSMLAAGEAATARVLPGRGRRAADRGLPPLTVPVPVPEPPVPTHHPRTAHRPMTNDTGFVLWLTGLSGAGKSTVAAKLGPALAERGHRVELLDGDEVRTNIC
jgi:hypothetical protein